MGRFKPQEKVYKVTQRGLEELKPGEHYRPPSPFQKTAGNPNQQQDQRLLPLRQMQQQQQSGVPPRIKPENTLKKKE
jgi:hypothetical protein